MKIGKPDASLLHNSLKGGQVEDNLVWKPASCTKFPREEIFKPSGRTGSATSLVMHSPDITQRGGETKVSGFQTKGWRHLKAWSSEHLAHSQWDAVKRYWQSVCQNDVVNIDLNPCLATSEAKGPKENRFFYVLVHCKDALDVFGRGITKPCCGFPVHQALLCHQRNTS